MSRNSFSGMIGDPVVDVTVTDPQNSGMGPMKHTTYQITCKGPGGVSAKCRHRFSEFLSLRKDLLEALPGVVVPPLPEKQVLNRFSAEFIEKRREMLEIFLTRALDHPIVSASERVHTFLIWPDTLRSPVVARTCTFRLPPGPAVDSALGDSLKDAMKMLVDFEQQIDKVRYRFKRLQGRQSEDGTDLHELSQGIKVMADNPMNSVLAIALRPLSNGTQELATHTKRQAEGVKHGLLAKLKLHRMLALAIIEQFKGREKVSKEIEAMNSKIKDMLQQSTKCAPQRPRPLVTPGGTPP